MFDNLIQQFTGSRQGQSAMSRLGAQGFAPAQSQAFMGAALPTAARVFQGAQSGGMAGGRAMGLLDVGSSHYVTNFLSGAVSGLLRGQGVMGSAVDGVQGAAGGHVAQVIASQFGLPQRVAGTVGAIVTPLIIDWLFEQVQGGGLNLDSLFGGGSPMQGGAPSQAGGFGGGFGGSAPQAGGFGGGFGGSAPQAGGFGGGFGGSAPQAGGFGSPAPQPGGFSGGFGSPAPQSGGFGSPNAGVPNTGGQGSPISATVEGGLGAIFSNLFGS